MAGGRTGTVSIEAFDVGVAETLGAEVIQVEFDREMANVYAIQVPAVAGPPQYKGWLPVYLGWPEDVHAEILLPQVVIVRSSVQPASERRVGSGSDYKIPSLLPDRLETKPIASPVDITYDIHLRCRLRTQANRMLHFFAGKLAMWRQVFVRDTEGEERGYYAFVESYEDLSDVADVSMRLQGHTISVRVVGELDLLTPYTEPRFRELSLNMHVTEAP